MFDVLSVVTHTHTCWSSLKMLLGEEESLQTLGFQLKLCDETVSLTHVGFICSAGPQVGHCGKIISVTELSIDHLYLIVQLGVRFPSLLLLWSKHPALQ